MSDDPRTDAAAMAIVIDGNGFEGAAMRVGQRRAEVALAAADAWDAGAGWVRLQLNDAEETAAQVIFTADGYTDKTLAQVEAGPHYDGWADHYRESARAVVAALRDRAGQPAANAPLRGVPDFASRTVPDIERETRA